MFCMVLLVGTVSALEFLPVKQYDEITQTVTIVNNLGLGKTLFEARLVTPHFNKISVGGIDTLVAEIDLVYFDEGDVLNLFESYKIYDIKDNLKEVNRELTFKYGIDYEVVECFDISEKEQECWIDERVEWIVFNNLNEVPKNVSKIGIFADTYLYEQIEWIPQIAGKKVSEWAIWEISTAVYNGIFISTQDGAPSDLFFKPDGTRLYESGWSGDKFYQSTCSDAWNLSSCTYDNVNISTQDGEPLGFFFKPDGTRLYEAGLGGPGIGKFYQSTCTDAWNLSSCSYDGVIISAQDNTPTGLFFKPDGTRLYEIGSSSKKVYQYTCSDAWNLSSCSYDTLFISTEDNGPNGLFFKPDGTRLYEIGESNDKVYQYTCSDAWNLSSCTYDTLFISAQGSSPQDLFFKPDGTRLYEISSGANDRIYQYDLYLLTQEGIFYNSTSFETKEETFTINITTDGTQTTSAKFYYDGVSQGVSTKTGTDTTANFSNTIQIPTSTGEKEFYWEITLGSSPENSAKTNQTVNHTQFGLCNATLTIPYINFTFVDEETSLNINATIDTSTWEYWLGDGTYTKELLYSNTTANDNYAFCLIPGTETLHNTRSIQYASPGYPQRKYDASNDLTNATTNQTLYLLASGDGVYTTIHVVDQVIANVIGAEVTVERQFSGVWTVVGQEITDDSGSVTFWVNPDYSHRFTFTHDDCDGTTVTIRPTQTRYTQQLVCGVDDDAEYASPYKGIEYVISPKPGSWLSEESVYSFTFNITANLSNLMYYSLNITDKDGTQLNSTFGTTATGGNLTVTLDTTDYALERLYGHYYIDTGNGTIYLIDPALWSVRTIEAGSGSLLVFFQNLVASEPDIEDNYNSLVLIFFIIFVGFAAFCYSTGMELAQPGISLFILFFLVLMLSIAGFFTIDFAPSDFMNRYGVFLVIFFITAGFTLGQWGKT